MMLRSGVLRPHLLVLVDKVDVIYYIPAVVSKDIGSICIRIIYSDISTDFVLLPSLTLVLGLDACSNMVLV